MEELVQRLGFTDEKEFHRMVASVDLSTPEKREAFRLWKENDGSKDGLLKLSKMILQSGSSDLLLGYTEPYVNLARELTKDVFGDQASVELQGSIGAWRLEVRTQLEWGQAYKFFHQLLDRWPSLDEKGPAIPLVLVLVDEPFGALEYKEHYVDDQHAGRFSEQKRSCFGCELEAARKRKGTKLPKFDV